MIVPMKKVTLLALHSERESALSALRRLGIMQIELNSCFSEKSSSVSDELNRIGRIYSLLKQIAADNKLPAAENKSSAEADDIIARTVEISDRRHHLDSEIIDLRRRLDALGRF